MSLKRNKKPNNFLALFGVLFLSISLLAAVVTLQNPQNIIEKAASAICPGAEACPYPGQPSLLRSCHPGEADGTVAESLCNVRGRVETCGAGSTKYCCPAAGAAWTTNMTACATPMPTPTVRPTVAPTIPPTIAPTLTPSPSPRLNPWDVDQNGFVNIIDIGLVIDNYAKSPSLDPRTDVNTDGAVDIVDIGIIIDHYTF